MRIITNILYTAVDSVSALILVTSTPTMVSSKDICKIPYVHEAKQ